MKRILLVLIWFCSIPAFGSHIVGGEFELIHLDGAQYRINLIIYFDEINGIPGNKAQDRTISAKIYQKSNNALITGISLHYTKEFDVEYTVPDCSLGFIRTSKMYYTNLITLSTNRYSHPQGYYIVWERCCRNYNLTNIVSDQPPVGVVDFPTAAGQAFYLEFPPVVKNGNPFINSSPRLFPPLSDYGCPGREYYADFSGTDDDGDSLVYTIVVPWDSQNHNPYPGSNPGPYPEVDFEFPFSQDNVMGGSPKLAISKDGVLTVTPTIQGLFVFAVKCEEFRDGELIGVVRRDFQMYVVDECNIGSPPEIAARPIGSEDAFIENNLVVNFDQDVGDEARCIEVRITDPDSQNPDNANQESIGIRAIPLGFKANINGILPEISEVIITGDTAAIFEVCFPQCPFKSGPFQIGIISYDDSCPQPFLDTMVVTLEIQPPDNNAPYFANGEIDVIVEEGSDMQSWTIVVLDDDNHNILVGFNPIGFELSDVGMSFTQTTNPGNVESVLFWDPSCKKYDFTTQTAFDIFVVAEDLDECNQANVVFDTVTLTINIPYNNPPVIFTDPPIWDTLKNKVNEPFQFDLQATDLNGDPLTLEMVGIKGNVSPASFQFQRVSGTSSVSSSFSWTPSCEVFQSEKFNEDVSVTFRAVDSRCRNNFKADTLTIDLNISDIISEEREFIPPNFITPFDKDGCNDYFAMEGYETQCNGELINIPNLPLDNCARKFLGVNIYNRWGKQVFESNQRDFRWYASNASLGVYYYLLRFSDKEYKGSLTISN